MANQQQQQIQQNYAAFCARLPNLVLTYGGTFALMHDGAIVEFFDTVRDAYVAGLLLYPDGIFSVQAVPDTLT